MQWNQQQNAALQAVQKWHKNPKRSPIFRIFGYAGTGKTTLAKYFASEIDGDVYFAAYTGKAALMLRKNGCDNASTIHSLIYKSYEDQAGIVHYKLNKTAFDKRTKLIIIDECSMVDSDIGKDLLSFKIPILVLGDPAQLPPISGGGFFTDHVPDIMLTEIHRQAKDNPIIMLATRVREGLSLTPGIYGDTIITDKVVTDDLISHEQIICGRNITREKMNNKYRKMMNFDSPLPMIGEKLICLKNNSHKNILNGGMFKVIDLPLMKSNVNNFVYITLQESDTETSPVMCKIHASFFNDDYPKVDWRMMKGSDEFAYGYAITGHKSQGSQWDNILIYNESWCFGDKAKNWLYTAITRAQNRLTIVL